MRASDAMLERLERVIETLQDNSVKMGQMLAVHDEKLDKQDRIDAVLFEKIESVHREVNRQSSEIKAGCERDIRKVDERLRKIEKDLWGTMKTFIMFLGKFPEYPKSDIHDIQPDLNCLKELYQIYKEDDGKKKAK